MNVLLRIVCFYFLIFNSLYVSGNDLKKVLRAIEKEDFEKVFQLLEENIEDEPVNPGSKWLYAELLSTDSLPFYDMSRSREFINDAITDFSLADDDQLEDFIKLGYTKSDLLKTYDKIEQLFYLDAQLINTIASLQNFIDIYPKSEKLPEIIYKRDSITYDSIRIINTWQSYLYYMNSFPESEFFETASTNYESLLYYDKSKDDKLSNYIDFISNYPTSPFVNQAVKEVYKQSTINGSAASFSKFIKDYPWAKELRNKAFNILYHLDKDEFIATSKTVAFYGIDSLEQLKSFEDKPLIPILKNGKFGFYSLEGEVMIEPGITQFLDANFHCKLLDQNIFLASIDGFIRVLNRQYHVLYEGEVYQIKDLGFGFLFLEGKENNVIHKSGETLISRIQDASVLGGRFIKASKNNKIALLSFLGIQLSAYEFDDVRIEGNFWIFEKEGKLSLYNERLVAVAVIESTYNQPYEFDEIEFINDSVLIGFRGNEECLINSKLEFIIPWGDHTVYPNISLNYAKIGDRYKLYDDSINAFFKENEFDEILINENWIALKNSKWHLLSDDGNLLASDLDSVGLFSESAIYLSTVDSAYILFSSDTSINVNPDDLIKSIFFRNEDGKVSTSYLMIENRGEKSILNMDGEILFRGKYDAIDVIDDSLFRVTIRNKQGIINRSGNTILNPIYDFIQQKEGIGQLLRSGKIGGFDFTRNIKLPENYESGFTRFGKLYLTQKEGYYGLIDSVGRIIIDFKCTAIREFNDSTSWIKTDSSWQLVSHLDSKPVLSNILDYTLLPGSTNIKYFNFLSNNGYGIISNDFKVKIKPKFNNIRIFEGKDASVIMCEQHLEEAELYIMIAYNMKGERIYSAAYTPEEYEKIYCE